MLLTKAPEASPVDSAWSTVHPDEIGCRSQDGGAVVVGDTGVVARVPRPAFHDPVFPESPVPVPEFPVFPPVTEDLVPQALAVDALPPLTTAPTMMSNTTGAIPHSHALRLLLSTASGTVGADS